MTIRSETPADHEAVYDVNRRAFGQPDEADLVNSLRREVHPYVSLVAETEAEIVGHILFSPVSTSSPNGSIPMMGLAPMAVLPEWQRQGVGTRLVQKGLGACRRRGVAAVVVLGPPDYDPRFGFRPAVTFGLRSAYDVPEDAFMAMEIQEGALQNVSGTVHYHPAFGAVE